MSRLLCYSIFAFLVVVGNAQTTYNQSAIVDFFNGDTCISTANNVVGAPVNYSNLPDGRPNLIPAELLAENLVFENIVFTPPLLGNTQENALGDFVAAVLPTGPTTIVQTFTVNGVNYRSTVTISVGGYCDNLPSTTTPAATTSAPY